MLCSTAPRRTVVINPYGVEVNTGGQPESETALVADRVVAMAGRETRAARFCDRNRKRRALAALHRMATDIGPSERAHVSAAFEAWRLAAREISAHRARVGTMGLAATTLRIRTLAKRSWQRWKAVADAKRGDRRARKELLSRAFVALRRAAVESRDTLLAQVCQV